MEYNVIWIDDEWDTRGASFIQTCKLRHHIIIKAYKTRKEGMEALEKNIDEIDAIILDAKAYNNSELDEMPDVDGLFLARDRIKELSMKKYIPLFIFTRQPDLFTDKMFEKSVGKFYRKDEEGQRQLIEDLKSEVERLPRFQVKQLYNDSLSLLYSMNMDARESVLDIFEAMHYPANHPDFKPIRYFNSLRQILEYNFRAANKYCIIPNDCFDEKGDPILGECSRYLNGKETKYTKIKVRYGQENDRVVPSHIELLIRTVLEIGHTNSHSTKLSDTELQELEQYLNKNVFNSRYLIYSLALNVCEITLWFKNYIDSHQDIEKNKKMCQPLNGNETDKQTSNENEKENKRLLGAINKEKNKVYSYDLNKNIIIDKKYGFQKGYSPKEYDYGINEIVSFDLKELINPKDNSPISFAINVRPSSKEKEDR